MTDRENDTATPSPALEEEAQPSDDGPDRPGNDHHATNTRDHATGSPDRNPKPPQTISAPRRLTITVPGDHAEAIQFTNGMVMACWSDPPQPYVWRDLDALREQWPDAVLAWLDPEPTEGTVAAPAPGVDLGRPISELSDSGLLWLINRTVFHPRGFALALHADGTGRVTGWSLSGDGTEAWSFPEEADQRHFQRAEETLKPAGRQGGSTGQEARDAEPVAALASVFVAEAIWFENNPVDGRERIAVRPTLDGALAALRGHELYGGDLVATETTSGSELGTDAVRTWAVHERNEKPSDEGLLWITEEQLRAADEEAPNA